MTDKELMDRAEGLLPSLGFVVLKRVHVSVAQRAYTATYGGHAIDVVIDLGYHYTWIAIRTKPLKAVRIGIANKQLDDRNLSLWL